MDLYQILLALILAAFYTAYIAKGILLKRQGIKSNRLAKGDKPANVRRLEYGLLAVTYGMVVVQIISIYLLPPVFAMPGLRIIGLLVAFVGSVFFIAAIIVMKDSWRAGIDNTQKTKFVQTGIYRYSRNPAFAGFDLLYIGTALCFPNIWSIVLTIVGILLFHLQVLSEENHLKTTFGNEYIEYMANVRRYFGRRKLSE